MMLYRTLNAVLPAFRAIFSEFGITERQWRVLRTLWDNDGCSLLALADSALIPGPSLVGVIDRLARDGLVERRRSDIDRRVVHIFVTRNGKALKHAVQPKVDAVYAALETSISPARWTSLFKALDEIVDRNPAKSTLAANR